MKIQAPSDVPQLVPAAVAVKSEMPEASAISPEPKAPDEEIPFPSGQGSQVHLE